MREKSFFPSRIPAALRQLGYRPCASITSYGARFLNQHDRLDRNV